MYLSRLSERRWWMLKRHERKIVCRIDFLFSVLAFMGRHWRGLLSALSMAVGGYLIWSGFEFGAGTDSIREWLKGSGDTELLGRYDGARDANERSAWGVVFKSYEKRYGKDAWTQYFKRENSGENVAYMDVAKLAVGIPSAEERGEFLNAHAAAYETCVQNDDFELAFRYGRKLEELRGVGGKAWRVASRNPFAVCVYHAVRQKPDLWDWYLDNHEWCDSFLMTVEPELDEGVFLADDVLAEAVESVRKYSSLLKQFFKEISALSGEKLEEIADGGNLSNCRESLFASCFRFVRSNHDVLEPMLKEGIPMLEAMAVVANNYIYFGLQEEEEAVDRSDRFRNAAEFLIKIHNERKIVWDFASDEHGLGCLEFCKQVKNDEWCEQIIGKYGDVDVVTFLNRYYGESPQLLKVAAEALYRYQDLAWAMLNEYCENKQVKRLLLNPRIGSRLVPYYFKKGYDGFSKLDKGARWIDELLDRNGNVKRLDVDWYEMLPIGGDVATVVKKWVKDRPVTTGEYIWAVVDVADTAALAFSFGMSKVATTKKMVSRSVRASSRKMSFLKKVSKWHTPGAAFRKSCFAPDAIRKTPSEMLARSWKKAGKMPPETWQNIYKGAKALMWCRYLGHTVPNKLPDAMHTALESAGEFAGRTMNALVAGAGDGLKAAVREALALPRGGAGKLIHWIVGGVVFVLGTVLFLKTGKKRNGTSKAFSSWRFV